MNLDERNYCRSKIKSKTFTEIFNRWRALPGQSKPSEESGHADDFGVSGHVGETDQSRRTKEIGARTEGELEETNEDDKKGDYPDYPI